MKAMCIDLAQHNIPMDALMRCMRGDADRIVLIGGDAEVEKAAREAGYEVVVLPAGSKCPDGVMSLPIWPKPN